MDSPPASRSAESGPAREAQTSALSPGTEREIRAETETGEQEPPAKPETPEPVVSSIAAIPPAETNAAPIALPLPGLPGLGLMGQTAGEPGSETEPLGTLEDDRLASPAAGIASGEDLIAVAIRHGAVAAGGLTADGLTAGGLTAEWMDPGQEQTAEHGMQRLGPGAVGEFAVPAEGEGSEGELAAWSDARVDAAALPMGGSLPDGTVPIQATAPFGESPDKASLANRRETGPIGLTRPGTAAETDAMAPGSGLPEGSQISRMESARMIGGAGVESFSGDVRPKETSPLPAMTPAPGPSVRGETALAADPAPSGMPTRGLKVPVETGSPTSPASPRLGGEAADAPSARSGRDQESGTGADPGDRSNPLTPPAPAGGIASGTPGAGFSSVAVSLGASASMNGTAPAAARPVDAPAPTVAAAQMAAPVEAPRTDPGNRFPALAVRVESDAVPGNPSPAPVDVVFEQRGRELNVSVRSADPALASELQQSLPELSQRLDREGFDSWLTAGPERINAAAGSDLRQSGGGDPGGEGGSMEDRGSRNGSPHGQEREPGRGQSGGRHPGDESEQDMRRRPLRWLEELTRQAGLSGREDPAQLNPGR